MPYHVQLRGPMKRAWAFNLAEEALRRDVLTPWLANLEFELGDRRWKPSESDLRILRGPELAPPDLAYGQGWNAAERSGEDVTREVLAGVGPASPASVTVIAETAEIGEAAAQILRAAGFTAEVVVDEPGP